MIHPPLGWLHARFWGEGVLGSVTVSRVGGGMGAVSLRGSQSLSDWVLMRSMEGQRLRVKLTPSKLG